MKAIILESTGGVVSSSGCAITIKPSHHLYAFGYALSTFERPLTKQAVINKNTGKDLFINQGLYIC
jgi:hypothetical protein